MMKEFYQQTVKEVLDRVESRETGLTSEPVSYTHLDVYKRQAVTCFFIPISGTAAGGGRK